MNGRPINPATNEVSLSVITTNTGETARINPRDSDRYAVFQHSATIAPLTLSGEMWVSIFNFGPNQRWAWSYETNTGGVGTATRGGVGFSSSGGLVNQSKAWTTRAVTMAINLSDASPSAVAVPASLPLLVLGVGGMMAFRLRSAGT